VCTDCNKGKSAASAGYTYACDECNVGRYSSVNGTISCTECSAGTVMPLNGSTVCEVCTAGRYQSITGQQICDICIAPTYSSADSVAIVSCSISPTGFYVNESGMSSPLPCPAGSYSNIIDGATTCTQCSVGRYLASEQGISCLDADAGYYVAQNGFTLQVICPAGSYSPVAASSTCFNCSTVYTLLPFTPRNGAISVWCS
jgi:hypothetical protein